MTADVHGLTTTYQPAAIAAEDATGCWRAAWRFAPAWSRLVAALGSEVVGTWVRGVPPVGEGHPVLPRASDAESAGAITEREPALSSSQPAAESEVVGDGYVDESSVTHKAGSGSIIA